ncbi:glycosyl transferase family 1 [Spirochaetia bacterium]|nr:glycosyl transferase family 1 [Spirochaetia bacterium]
MRKEHFDIIHSQEMVIGSILAFTIAKKMGIRVRIMHSQNNYISNCVKRLIILLSRPFLKKTATDFYACSTEAGNFLFGKKINYEIIHNAIHAERFIYNENLRKDVRTFLNISSDTAVIGHVGRFEEQKNHTFLIKLFYQIMQTKSNVVLLLVGEGEAKRHIQNMVNDLNISNKVIFYGLSDKMSELYSAMDIFVFPSLFEGLGIVGIEAQCSGLPVIASTNISKGMKITDLVTWLSLKDGVDVWKDKTLEILAEKEERRNMSSLIADAGYNIITETKKLEDRYSALIL